MFCSFAPVAGRRKQAPFLNLMKLDWTHCSNGSTIMVHIHIANDDHIPGKWESLFKKDIVTMLLAKTVFLKHSVIVQSIRLIGAAFNFTGWRTGRFWFEFSIDPAEREGVIPSNKMQIIAKWQIVTAELYQQMSNTHSLPRSTAIGSCTGEVPLRLHDYDRNCLFTAHCVKAGSLANCAAPRFPSANSFSQSHSVMGSTM